MYNYESQNRNPFDNIYAFSFPLMPKRDEVCSGAANRLLSMTKGIGEMFVKINKYKRARQQVLQQIKNNRGGLNYIG